MDPGALSSALRDAATAQPEVEDRLDLVTGRGRRRRRRARTVLGGFMLVGVIAGGLVLAGGDESPIVHTVDEPPSAVPIEAGESCPGSVTRRVDGGDPGADALPPLSDASIDRGRALAVLAEHHDELLESFGASRAEIGPGFGRAWVRESGGDYSVVDVDDYGILVEVPEEAACPEGGALHQRMEGVPLFFFVRGGTATTLKDTQHAGALGANGGVIWGGQEMQSTPGELFEDQDDGSTVVFSEAPPDSAPGLLRFYLGAERAGERLCVALNPAGKTGPVAQLCDIPAYRSNQQIVEESFAGEGLVTLDGVPTRVVYGMTYLDAASVSLDDGSGVEVQTGLPFWMHRFFALPAPAGTTDVRLLDSQGEELARVRIGDR